MPEYARLRVFGHGNIDIAEAIAFLRDIQRAYNGLYSFTIYTDIISRDDLRAYLHWPRFHAPLLFKELMDERGFDDMVLSRDRLVMRAVKLASPGYWDLLGIAKVVEAIRGCINDYYERRKDSYRMPAEQRRLTLENLEREVDIVAKGMQVLKEAGMPDYERQSVAERLVIGPLAELMGHQDRGVITEAEVLPPGYPRKESAEDA